MCLAREQKLRVVSGAHDESGSVMLAHRDNAARRAMCACPTALRTFRKLEEIFDADLVPSAETQWVGRDDFSDGVLDDIGVAVLAKREADADLARVLLAGRHTTGFCAGAVVRTGLTNAAARAAIRADGALFPGV